MHTYPDGSTSSSEPSDGQVFYIWDTMQTVKAVYQYDGFLMKWYDITNGSNIGSTLDLDKALLDEFKALFKCECGAEKTGSNRHSHWCQKFV